MRKGNRELAPLGARGNRQQVIGNRYYIVAYVRKTGDKQKIKGQTL